MIFAVSFVLIGVGLVAVGHAIGFGSTVAAVIATGFLAAGAANIFTGALYGSASAFKHNPGPLFKTRDGRLKHPVRLLMWPYLILEFFWWRKYREKRQEPLFEQVSEGLWLGSLPADEDLAELKAAGVSAELDLVAEMQAPTEMRRSWRYLCLPTLDGCAPDLEDFAAGTEFVSACRAEGRGVLIHCAFGHGRSAAMMAASLVRLGIAKNGDEAWGMIRKLTRIAYLSREQKAMLEKFLGEKMAVKTEKIARE